MWATFVRKGTLVFGLILLFTLAILVAFIFSPLPFPNSFLALAVFGVLGAVAGGAGTAGVEKESAVGCGKRAAATFWRLALRYSAAAVSSRGDMGTVTVKEVTDLLKTEFVAEVAHQESRNLNVLKAGP